MNRHRSAAAPRPNRARRPLGLAAAAALLLPLAAALPPAAAQTARDDQNQPPDPLSAEALAPEMLARLAYAYARSVSDPPERERFLLAADLFSLARDLLPQDRELARLALDAADAAGDDPRAANAARKLLAVDPANQRAQLRVALHGVRRAQSVDERLDVYARLVDENRLAPAVRSRLALDAALLARENGRDDEFLRLLTRSTSLDPSHKDAAALHSAYFLPRTDDPQQRFDILANVLLADPFDTASFENLALELLARGAFTGATRFLELRRAIIRATGQDLSPEELLDLVIARWNAAGPEFGINILLGIRAATVQAEQRRRESLIAQGLDPGPEASTLFPPRLAITAMAIGVAAGDDDLASEFLGELLAGLGAVAQRARLSAEQVGTQDAAQDLQRADVGIQLQSLWAILFSGKRLDLAPVILDNLNNVAQQHDRQQQDEDDPNAEGLKPESLERFAAWLLMHDGRREEDPDKLQQARQRLTPLAQDDPSARWALAELEQAAGNIDDAKRHYALLARDQPATVLGSTAWTRLRSLHDQPVRRPQAARRLDQTALELAPWLNEAVGNPAFFMAVRAEHTVGELQIAQPLTIDVSLRNRSPWPLAVGPQLAIPARTLLSPAVQYGLDDVSNNVPAVVVDFGDLLRLDRLQQATLRLTPSRDPAIGQLLDYNLRRRIGFRWQITQGFVAGEDGSLRPGSIALSSLSDTAARRADPPPDDPDAVVRRLDAAALPPQIRRHTLHALSLLLAGENAPQRPADDQREDLELALARAIGQTRGWLRTELLLRLADTRIVGPDAGPAFVAAVAEAAASERPAAARTPPERAELVANVLALAFTDRSLAARYSDADDPLLAGIARSIHQLEVNQGDDADSDDPDNDDDS